MQQDKLTRAERIRLEAFAQATGRHQMRPLDLDEHMIEAEKIETWLRQAREDA